MRHDVARLPLSERSIIALAYVAVFFGLLPLVLWRIGLRIDASLALSRAAAVVPFGVILFAFGVAFMLANMTGLSIRGRGLPISHLPPLLLVTRGAYARLRHPIYVGYTLAFSGLGLHAGSLGIGLGASALLACGAAVYALGFEEPRLLRRHGGRFREYVETVPLLPGSKVVSLVATRAWKHLTPHAQWLADRPVMFRLGPTLWVTFGLFAGLGTFAATALLGASLSPAAGVARSNALLIGATGATLGCGYLVARLYRIRHFWKTPFSELRRVGFVSWGGYLGLLSFAAAFAYSAEMSVLGVLDLVLLSALLASAIGRLGCLSYGCCCGRPHHDGVRYRRPESRIVRELGRQASVPRVPTQLLSSLHPLATFALVAPLSGHALAGAPGAFVVVLYSLGRFAIEFLREEPRYSPLELTRGQLASAAAFVLALLGLFLLPADGSTIALALPTLSASVLVVPAVSGALAFVVCGVHVRSIGRW